MVLVATGGLNGLRTVDALSFALVVVGVVITALTVLGSFTLINTWNDIDKRTSAIVEKYERDAKAELERNAAERQQAITDTGARVQSEVNHLASSFKRRGAVFAVQAFGIILAYSAFSLFMQRRAVERVRREFSRVHRPTVSSE